LALWLARVEVREDFDSLGAEEIETLFNGKETPSTGS
jgi:hypothetical protein